MTDPVPWIALWMTKGVGSKTFAALLDRFGSPEAVFDAAPEELATVPRITPDLAERILSAPLYQVEAELYSLDEEGISVLTLGDDDYPANLRLISDAPPVLFVRGQVLPEDEKAVAVVGSREASPEGLRLAEEMGCELATRGLTVVSGLARGIDTAAHQGALDGDGRTLAVLGSGIRVIHPRANEELARDIARSGAVLSEWHPNSPPRGPQLMARDRVISGLSLAVIVVEAGERSGSLDTASRARKQGRLVFAVDGGSLGTTQLLGEGALPVPATGIEWDDLTAQVGGHTLDDRPAPPRQARLL